MDCDAIEPCAALCSSGALTACTHAGRLELKAGSVERADAAARYFARGCPDKADKAGRDAQSCHLLAVLLTDGRGVPKDGARARAIFQSLCDEDLADSCDALSMHYEKDPSAPDPSKADAFAERACKLGSSRACYRLGRNIDQRLPHDEARARALIERACELDKKPNGTTAIMACSGVTDFDKRVTPRQRAVVRTFTIGTRDAQLDKDDRSLAEAKKLARDAVAKLNHKADFDAVANEYGGTNDVRAISRGKRVLFKMKLDKGRVQPAFEIRAGQATFEESATFGVVVWYRLE